MMLPGVFKVSMTHVCLIQFFLAKPLGELSSRLFKLEVLVGWVGSD